MPQQERFRPLVPTSTLPDFHRPSTNYLCHPLTAQAIDDFLASPTSLVGKQFMMPEHVDDGFFYRVTSVEVTLDGNNKFGVQYEDIRYDRGVLLLIITSLIHYVALLILLISMR